MAAFLVRGTTPLNMMQDKENGKMSKVKKTGENGGGRELASLLLAVAIGVTCPSYAATIIWDEAQNVSADADVSTEGDFVCAYNENGVDATVNGVLFLRLPRFFRGNLSRKRVRPQ